jgi:hypothetical protein
MPCNMLFRRDLHPLILLGIYVQPCRMHGVNSLQHYFRHYLSPCQAMLWHFCMLAGALHDIRHVYQFIWLFSIPYRPYGDGDSTWT